MKKIPFLHLFVFGLLAASILLIQQQPTPAAAVSAADWRAGNIISDSLFYDNNAMSVGEIQNFLNSLVPFCDTNGSQPAREFGRGDISRAEYARRVGWPGPPYVCLKDYYQVPRSDQIINNYSGHRPAGSISAAEIIKRAADTYRVSPKALLVLLQKESPGPLPLDIWPLQSQYRNAMGSGCPDTAPCNPQLAGFYNQMMSGAERFRVYYDNPGSFRHQSGRNNLVYYHPDLNRCGSSQVYIESRATAGLYNYTPYQPNQAALNNLNGTGDSCSAYGNRNFWRIYSAWFGSTQGVTWSGLQDPRIMVANKNTSKVDPVTNNTIQHIPAGLEMRFDTKSDDCLRTRHDTQNGNNACIKISNLSEFTPQTKPLSSTDDIEYRKINQFTCKVDFTRDNTTNPCLDAGLVIQFQQKVTSLDVDYLVTKHDSTHNIPTGFRQDRLSDPIKVTWSALLDPRIMVAGSNTHSINPYTNEKIRDIPAGTQIKFTSKADDCLRSENDTTGNAHECVKIQSLSELNPAISNLSPNGATTTKVSTRWTCKVDYMRDKLTDECVGESSQQQFVKQTTVMGVTYLITSEDNGKNTYAFRADRFK